MQTTNENYGWNYKLRFFELMHTLVLYVWADSLMFCTVASTIYSVFKSDFLCL